MLCKSTAEKVYILAGIKRWHGAAPHSWFAHLAIKQMHLIQNNYINEFFLCPVFPGIFIL